MDGLQKILEEWAKRCNEHVNEQSEQIFIDAPMKHLWRCECGSDKLKSPGHSTWCPKHKKE